MKNEEKLFILQSAQYLLKIVGMESVKEFDTPYATLLRRTKGNLDNTIILLKKQEKDDNSK